MNWMRLNLQWIAAASALMAVVLARPGTPSSRTCPPGEQRDQQPREHHVLPDQDLANLGFDAFELVRVLENLILDLLDVDAHILRSILPQSFRREINSLCFALSYARSRAEVRCRVVAVSARLAGRPAPRWPKVMALTIARRHPIIVGERESGNNLRALGSFVVFSGSAIASSFRGMHRQKLGSFVVFSGSSIASSFAGRTKRHGPVWRDVACRASRRVNRSYEALDRLKGFCCFNFRQAAGDGARFY